MRVYAVDRYFCAHVMSFTMQPLGVPPTPKEVRVRLANMRVKLYRNKYVTFWDFADALGRQAFEQESFAEPFTHEREHQVCVCVRGCNDGVRLCSA